MTYMRKKTIQNAKTPTKLRRCQHGVAAAFLLRASGLILGT